MANPNTPADQSPPQITAAELRRRLLASTPPPIAATAASADGLEELAGEEAEAIAAAATGEASTPPGSWNGTQDLLARLRMPGKSGSVPVPATRSSASIPMPNVPDPLPNRAPVNRRTPAPTPAAPAAPARAYNDSASAIAGALNQLAELTLGANSGGDPSLGEIQRLRNENNELRTLLEEMKHLLQEASETEQRLTTKEKEFEVALGEKDSQIEELNTHLAGIEEQISTGKLVEPAPAPKTRTELEEWGDELEKESAKLSQDKKRVEEERRQLREDEEALENQMRQMEVSMARERALLARQETELKRLSAEIQHELEILQRGDAGLREQMAKFQRRAQEVMTKPPGGGRR
jgi:hypothetical protein